MANETILIVDADEKSQRVLEVSFKKAGYRVVMTDSVIQALEYVHAVRPDIIISDTQFSDGTDGFDFIEAVKADPASTNIPFLFLTEERALDRKMKGFEMGADDYLTKPVYIKEVTTRVELLLQKRAKDILTDAEADEIAGQLSDITMIDLLQMIEGSGRSGSIELERENRTAVVTFREGDIYDAICGKLQGEEAIYRLLLWPDGQFTVRYHDDVGTVDQIAKESGELLLEGIRRLERWNDQIKDLPPLGSTLEADFSALAQAMDGLPAEVGRVARLFDGVRTIRDVVDDSPFDDVTTLQITRRLLGDNILTNVTPEEASPEEASPANLAAWLEGQDRGRERSRTSPGRTTDTAQNERPRRETEQLEAEEPWKRRKTERIETSEAEDLGGERSDVSGDPRKTDPGLTTRTAETPIARISEVEELEEAKARQGEDGDWKFHFDDLDADDAIKKIEEDERRRRELEAQQLFEERETSGTLQQTPAISRESGEVRVPTEELDAATTKANAEEDAAVAESRIEGSEPSDEAFAQQDAMSELEEAELKRRQLEAETLERQRRLAEDARRKLMDGSPRLPGAQKESADRPLTPASGLDAAPAPREGLDRSTDQISDDDDAEPSNPEEQYSDDRRRVRRATPISAPALVSAKAVSLDESSEPEGRPRRETPQQAGPAETREAAVEEAEAVAREATEDIRQSAPHAAVDINEVTEDPVPRDVAEGLGSEVSSGDAFLDDDDEGAPPMSGSGPYDEVVAVSAFESSTVEDDEVDSTERVTKRMRQPNFAALTPLGEEVSEPVVAEGEDVPAGLEQQTDPSELEPQEIEAALDLLPPVERHSHDNEIVHATYDLTEISRRRRELALHAGESVDDRKARIQAAADRAARNAIRATTGLDPDDFVPQRAQEDDPDSSTEVWTNPELMARVDEIAEAWANADSSDVDEPDYDLIDLSETSEDPVDPNLDTIDIADDDTDPPVGPDEEDSAEDLFPAPEVSDLETVELDEDEKAGEIGLAETEERDAFAPEPSEPAEQADAPADGATEAAAATAPADESLEETSDVEAMADSSSEVSFFQEEFEPEAYEYPEEDEQPRWMLGIAGFLVLVLVVFIGFIVTTGGDDPAPDKQTTAAIAETTAPETTPVETTPVETTPTEVAGLDAEGAEYEAASNGLDVQASATEVSMLLAGLDPYAMADAGVAPSPDAGNAFAVNSETTPTEPVETTPAETTPSEPVEPVEPVAKSPEDEVRDAEKMVNREQFSKAIDKLKELAKSQPDNGKVAFLHGIAAVSVGRSGEAIAQFERAKSLGYRPARLYIELGGAYFIEGNKPKAKSAYEEFLKKQPNGDESDQVRTILQTQF